MLLLNISGSAARQTWPLTYLMEQHYFIFSWGLKRCCCFFFNMYPWVFDNLYMKGCLTNLSIFLFPIQEKINIILATAAAWTFVTPRWKSNELRASTFERHTSLQPPPFTVAAYQQKESTILSHLGREMCACMHPPLYVCVWEFLGWSKR